MPRISTHVLDTARGIPARGIAVSICTARGDERLVVGSAVTNADGRTDAPLLSGDEIPIAIYELTFHAGPYSRGQRREDLHRRRFSATSSSGSVSPMRRRVTTYRCCCRPTATAPTAVPDMAAAAATEVVTWCRLIASCSEEPGIITRTFLSPPMREVHAKVGAWMESSGMRVHVDAAGNIRGTYAGLRPDAPTLFIGSHLDTVPNAGAFDGVLGVVIGVALVQHARAADDCRSRSRSSGSPRRKACASARRSSAAVRSLERWTTKCWRERDRRRRSRRARRFVEFGLEPGALSQARSTGAGSRLSSSSTSNRAPCSTASTFPSPSSMRSSDRRGWT